MAEQKILDNFPTNFKGELIDPDHADYDEARQVWNGYFDKYPAAVARCTEILDVQKAVNFARENNLELSVKGGGHDYAGNSVCDDGLVIDLSPMREIKIDKVTQTAKVEGGATIGELDAKAQEHKLVTTGGTASSIGIGGLTLGGGTGYLVKRFGLTLDNLQSAEVVTAAGELLIVNKDHNADLFWAIRGGGGNFGIVTSFTFQLHKMDPEVLSVQYFYPLEEAGKVLKRYREFIKDAPDELQCYAFFMNVPPVAPFPEEFHGKTAFALIACHSGNINEGRDLVKEFINYGNAFLELDQPLPYVELQKAFDAGMPKGLRWYSKAHYINEISDKFIDIILKNVQPLKGGVTMAYFEPMGGCVKKIDPSETAFPHRKSNFSFHIMTGWNDKNEDEENIKWAKNFHNAVKEFATGGVYVNLLAHDEEERVKAAYGDNYKRLVEIKKNYDPDNLFHKNHNIKI